MNFGNKKKIKIASTILTFALVLTSFPLYVQAGDTWPFTGESAHGENQPSVHGYTSGHVLNWSPESDPGAELLRSRVPLQQRIDPLAATQSNPDLDPNIKMTNVSGDYGNAFIENAPYTNKFAQYHFGFWQYVDYWSPWHGTATAYTPPEYYDDLAQKDWQQKWFEFGMLNIPNPTYTDAAHKNGVMSLAGIFFSNNDRGQQTYKQMIVKDDDGNYPVAEKLIEMAEYFGYDGYFINQEEVGPNVTVADIPDYIGFMKALQKGGLYIQWYDSLNTATGSNTFARTINDNNISFLYDKNAGEQVSQSFFFDYGMGSSLITSAKAYLNNLNQQYGTDFDLFDVGFAGLEAGRDRFKSVQGNALSNKLSNGLPQVSIATLGADFVHAGLDEDMGLAWPVNHRAENDYQWMTKVREQLWWSGPNIDPKNTAKSSVNTASDVYADNRYWPGIASVIAERSVIGDSNFYTNFNTGHGLSYYVDGNVSNDSEWSNMSLQDIPVTWQWWQDTDGNRLTVDFDYGPEYSLASTQRFNYQQIGAYQGGSSLVINGDLDAENFLRLYKTDISVNPGSKLSITYNKSSQDDGSTLQAGLIFEDDPANVVKVAVQDSGKETNGWVTAELDLSAYAGKSIAVLGLVFDPGAGVVNDYQMNIGQISISDGSAVVPDAPAGLSISELHPNTKELIVKWNLDNDYSSVKQYNVYVNDVYMGGKYDEVFYVKQLPADSGVIKVAAVGADGREGPAATLPYDLTSAPSNITVDSREDGVLEVSWINAPGTSGDITVSVTSRNWITAEQPVNEQTVVPSGSTSAVFNNMPVNGDDYLVTVSSAGGQSVMASGSFIDKIAEPYAEPWAWNGDTLSLPMPNTRDWRYMYFYEDGELKNFPVTYISGAAGNKDRIIRGRTTKASLSFSSTAENIYVVMEDYAGNKSAPVYLRGKERYTVTFDSNGGEHAVPTVESAFGAKISEPSTMMTREGYEFLGWYNGDTKWSFAADSVKQDLTLTAKWKLKDPEVVLIKEGSFREGAAAALKAVAAGKGALSYSWAVDEGSGYNGISVTDTVYSIPRVTLDMEGFKYKVIVTNEEGGVGEAETAITVTPASADPVAPDFERNLDAGKTVKENEEVTLFVSTTGDVEQVVWEAKLKDSDTWTQVGEGSSAYTFTAQAEHDGALFRVVLQGIAGSNPSTAVSNELLLHVIPLVVNADPVIHTVTASKNPAEVGDTVTFTVQASGEGVLSYQWFKDGAPIAGATNAEYTIDSAAASDGGAYKVEVTHTIHLHGRDYIGVKESDEVLFTVETEQSAEWSLLSSLINQIKALKNDVVYTAQSIAELKSSSAYLTAVALTADSPADTVRTAYENLVQARSRILKLYVPVSPGTGTNEGAGGDSGGTKTENGTSPLPPANPSQMIVSGQDLLKASEAGVVAITVKTEVTSIDLPLNAGELLNQNILRIETDTLTLDIPPEVLKQMKDLLGDSPLSTNKLQLGIQPISLDQAGVTANSEISIKGSTVKLDLKVVDNQGATVKEITEPTIQPLNIKMPITTGLNADLLGIYLINNDGTLTYLGGARNGNVMGLEVEQAGTYALLEYKVNFQDVSDTHWAADAIQILAAKHWTQGVPGNKYEPGRTITRAEFTTLVAKALHLKEQSELKFNDVPSDAWYKDDLAKLVKLGLVSGRSADRFEPDAEISRQEIVTILMRALELQQDVDAPAPSDSSRFKDDSSIASWARASVHAAAELGLVKGQGDHFAPAQSATRAEAAQFAINFLLNSE
ncbi:endo-beta-N-acetylglucosaminidase [Paenibacillus antibioticophila]|uniref:endo-beta-N-acetylglucosaminidase n=1 Tax=Paenibacillus antibioticophila TaxID=1274374 RepID=UPI0009DB7603|nr:S-layer homology domain-containing protein [Paenibacillus antibioticophila]